MEIHDMPSCNAPTASIHGLASRPSKVLAPAVLGMMALLAGCADDQAPTEDEASELALYVEANWVNSGLAQGIPEDAFHAGWEKNKHNVYYICRVDTPTRRIPGKLYAGRCHTVEREDERHWDQYQVLVDPQRRLAWKDAADKPSANAVVAGYSGSITNHICQAEAHGSLIPGLLAQYNCYTTFGGESQVHYAHFRELVLR